MRQDKTFKTATLYRIVMTDHMCPHGLKSKDLLERQKFVVEDHHLVNREEIDAFKSEHDVKTTPQTFIDGDRIGGFDDLSVFFGKTRKIKDATTYKPIIVLFSVAALVAIAVTWLVFGTIFTGQTIEWFIQFSSSLSGKSSLA